MPKICKISSAVISSKSDICGLDYGFGGILAAVGFVCSGVRISGQRWYVHNNYLLTISAGIRWTRSSCYCLH